MSNPHDMSSDPTVVFPRVEVDPAVTPDQAPTAYVPPVPQVPTPDQAPTAYVPPVPQVQPQAAPTEPEPAAGSSRRGKGIVAGACAAALVVGGVAGYLIGASGSDAETPAPVAAPVAAPTTTAAAAPVPGPGQFLAASGTVDTVAGNTFVLETEDGTRITVATSAATRIITLQGDELADLRVGDSAVVQGAQDGSEFAADLVIAGALPGLVPTPAAAAPVQPEPAPVVRSEPQQQWTEPAPTQAPVATQEPLAPPVAEPAPTTPEIGPKRDDYGPKQDSYGPTGDYGPKQDSYGPKQDSYGPKGDYGPN